MKISGGHNYYIYIVTNKNKTVLYTGITNDLYRRLKEHEENSIPFRHKSFAGQYNAYFLLYYERFHQVLLQEKKKLKAGGEVKKKH